MRRALVIPGVVAAAGVAREAGACSCAPLSPCGLYRNADAVFVGDVVEIGKVSGAIWTTALQMRVVRAGKGAVEAGQLVAVEAPDDGSSKFGIDGGRAARFLRPQFYPAARERSTATAVEVRGGIVRLEPIVMRGALHRLHTRRHRVRRRDAAR